MKVFVCVVAIAWTLVICGTQNVRAQAVVRFACNNGTFGPTDELIAKLATCYNPDLYGTEEGKQNSKCAAFCFTSVIGGLKDGLPDKAAFDKVIESEYPSSQKESAKEQNDLCFERHGKIDLEDKTCEKIAAFSACESRLFLKVQPCPATA